MKRNIINALLAFSLALPFSNVSSKGLENIIISQTKTKKTEIKKQINLDQFEKKERVYVDDKIVKVYFNPLMSENKIYYVEPELSIEKSQEALFTAIMQNLYKNYKRNIEHLREWEEDLKKFYGNWINKIGGKFDFYEQIEKIWRNWTTYGEWEKIPWFIWCNYEFNFFSIFYKNQIPNFEFDMPLSSQDALQIYKVLKKEENLKKYSTCLLVETFKNASIKVRNRWIDVDVVYDMLNKYLIYKSFYLKVNPENKEEVNNVIKKIASDYNVNEDKARKIWWATLFNYVHGGLDYSIKEEAAKLCHDLIYRDLSNYLSDWNLREMYKTSYNKHIYMTLKSCFFDIDSLITEAYQLVR